MSDRRNPYTAAEIEQLQAWAAESAKTTGNDRADSPRRKAGDNFADKVATIRDSVTPPYTYPELAEPLGMLPDTVRGKLARRRKENPYPSMRQYENKPTVGSKRTPDHFSCEHWVDSAGNDVPEGTPGATLVYCERTKGPNGNTYYKPGRNGRVVEYCRRHQLIRLHRGRENRRKVQKGAAA